ncbi:MAG: endo-1,4-beta-xylanase [Propionibacteriaceae bacterium]|nr:endo-1,4-beta-xylanase [Propionibacteriaceae bacterium]
MQRVTVPDTSIPHRLGEAVLTLTSHGGTPLAETEVTVEQTRHAFGFGNIGFDLIDFAGGAPAEGDELLADAYLELFNTATLPFYWGTFEPTLGQTRTTELLTTARWFADRGVALKGHPLMWHTIQPRWLLDFDLGQVEHLQRERIRRDVSAFAGLIDTWDAINEVVIMPIFTAEDNAITRLARAKGRFAAVRLAFEEARETNPDVFLLVNDFDTTAAYECLIEGMLEAGIVPDAIGLQTHMHQGYKGEEHVLGVADRFARFGLPLHYTETSLVSGELMPRHIVDLNDFQVDSWPSTPEGEERQAGELVRHYRSLVGHRAVDVLTYWGITDRGSWLGAPIGLLRADGSRKPAFNALRQLITGDWWVPPTTARTDTQGRVAVRGFAGDYRVTVPGRGKSGFSLQRDRSESLRLGFQPPA